MALQYVCISRDNYNTLIIQSNYGGMKYTVPSFYENMANITDAVNDYRAQSYYTKIVGKRYSLEDKN